MFRHPKRDEVTTGNPGRSKNAGRIREPVYAPVLQNEKRMLARPIRPSMTR